MWVQSDNFFMFPLSPLSPSFPFHFVQEIRQQFKARGRGRGKGEGRGRGRGGQSAGPEKRAGGGGDKARLMVLEGGSCFIRWVKTCQNSRYVQLCAYWILSGIETKVNGLEYCQI